MRIKLYITAMFIYMTISLFPANSQAITVEEVIDPRQTNGVWVMDREQREKVGFSVGDRPSHLKPIDWLRVRN